MTEVKEVKEIPKNEPLVKPKEKSWNVNIQHSTMLMVVLVALFPVLFMWGVFERGVWALGYNMTMYGILIFALYFFGVNKWQQMFIKNLIWIIPLAGVFLSFSLYGNTFIKTINIFLLPFLVLLFSSLGRSVIKGNKPWTFGTVEQMFFRKSPMFSHVQVLLKQYVNGGGENSIIAKKVGIGIVALLSINTFIVMLLSSADSNFSLFISGIGEGMSVLSLFFKGLVTVLLFFCLIKIKLSWSQKHSIENTTLEKKRDDIIGGIVIGGTICTYLVFLVFQFESIFVGGLPLGVEGAASFAKSGFWQLFFISVINIVFFFVYFRKTHFIVQQLLFLFLLASFAILLSAGQRMFLYVSEYGMSYEKFYASYTVVFFGILFCIMMGMLLYKKYSDILKVTVFLFLWMYAIVTLYPVDGTIFHVNKNIALSQDNFKGKYQSHVLSTDIRYHVQELESSNKKLFDDQGWKQWLDKKEKRGNQYELSRDEVLQGSDIQQKKLKWYEKNIRSF